MTDIFSSIAELFSTRGIVGFILGVVFEYTFLKLRSRYLDKVDPKGRPHKVKIKRVYWVWALVFIVLGGVTYKSQVTYDAILQLSKDTKDCSKQFNEALKARAEINKEESQTDTRWQNANFERTKKLNELIRQFGSSAHPGYLEAKMPVDMKYYQDINQIFHDRDVIAQQRALVGYPEPTCGK